MPPYREVDPRIVAMDLRIRTVDVQMADPAERKVLRRVFFLFKDMPHLWNKKQECDNEERFRDLRMLTKIYKQYDRHATVCTLKRKLDILVRSYVEEWQRVKLSRLYHPDDHYKHKPTLWHFKDFRFLDSSIGIDWDFASSKDESFRSRLRRQVVNEEEPQCSTSRSESHSNSLKRSLPPSSSQRIPSKVVRVDDVPNVYLKQRADAVYVPNKTTKDGISAVYEPNKERRDEEDKKAAFQQFVESHLKDVDEKQKEIALKLIADTLGYARAGKLTDNSSLELGTLLRSKSKK